MTNLYYTAREGRRNANGHTVTRGEVYQIRRGDDTTPNGEDALELLGEYVHQSGGADIEASVLAVAEKAEVPTWGGYHGSWRQRLNLIKL